MHHIESALKNTDRYILTVSSVQRLFLKIRPFYRNIISAVLPVNLDLFTVGSKYSIKLKCLRQAGHVLLLRRIRQKITL